MNSENDFVIENGILVKYNGENEIVSIPEGVTAIGKGAFQWKKVEKVIIPDGVTDIGDSAFSHCFSLTSVVIPDSVTSIGDYAFSDCSGLTSIVIPGSVTSIGDDAFRGCSGLTSIVIPGSVTSIGNFAFSGCSGLVSITIPESVEEIKFGAFSGCESLTRLELKNNKTAVHDGVFDGFIHLANEDGFAIVDGRLLCCAKNDAEIVIPDGVTEIASCEGAFPHRENIVSIRLPKSVKKIEGTPFYGFSSLKTMYIYPESIGEKMFGSSGKTIELVLTEEGKAPLHMIGAFRKEYYSQTFGIKKDCLLPLGDDISDYDKLVACGKYEGFQMNEDGRMRAMLWRLSDSDNPVAEEQRKMFADFLTGKTAKVIKLAEEQNEPNYVRALIDIGAVTDSNKQKVKKALSNSSVEELRQMAIALDSVAQETPVEADANIDRKYSERLNTLKASTLLLKSGVEQLPGVLMENGKEYAPKEYLQLILAEYIFQYKKKVLEIADLADEVAEKLDRKNLSEAIVSIYENVSTKSNKLSLLPAVFRFADGKSITKIYRSYAGIWRYEEFVAVCLLLSDTREAMLLVEKNKMLDEYAAMRGTDSEYIRYTKLYDFGFNQDGKKTYDLGVTRLEISINPDLTLSLYDTAKSKEVKSVPKKDVDPELYEMVNSDFTEIKKNLKKAVRSFGAKLFQLYLSGTKIPTEQYTSVYLTNPVLRQIVGLLVWSQGGKTFVLKNGTAIDSEMQPYVLGTEEIFVAHPMEMKKNEVEAWQNYFVSYNLKQPFSQIWEPIIDPSTIKEDRYVGCYIPFYCFRNREKHGITIEDDDFHDDIDIELKDCDATIERIDWHRHEINNDDNFEITCFGFKKYSRQVNHIVAYLDKITVIGRILKDDIAVEQFLPQFTFAQLNEFIKLASENKCLNVTALLLDYKNRTFGAFDPMEEFVLDI